MRRLYPARECCNGDHADLAAVLAEVACDPARAAEYGRAGRERAAAEFSWQQIAATTIELYQQVLASDRDGSSR